MRKRLDIQEAMSKPIKVIIDLNVIVMINFFNIDIF